MKHTLLLSLLLFVLCSCHPRHNADVPSPSSAIDTATVLASFRQLHFDTLSVACINDSLENEHSFLHGVAMDTFSLRLFPDTVTHRSVYFFSASPEEQKYAVGRFELDESYEAYLFRYPVEGYATGIDILVYDKKNKKFLNESLNLANNWGDAGEQTVVSSILHKKSNGLEIDMTQNFSRADPADTTFNTFIHSDISLLYRVQQGLISETSHRVLKCDTIIMGRGDTTEAMIRADTIPTDK